MCLRCPGCGAVYKHPQWFSHLRACSRRIAAKSGPSCYGEDTITIGAAKLLLLGWATPVSRLCCTCWSAAVCLSLAILRGGCFTGGPGVVRMSCCTRPVRPRSVGPVEKTSLYDRSRWATLSWYPLGRLAQLSLYRACRWLGKEADRVNRFRGRWGEGWLGLQFP